MRIYHFLRLEDGLDDIRHKYLKIARINELNDPFEMLSPALGDRKLRRKLHEMRDWAHETYGFICFSQGWQNPVQWSHYADRHRGICLGFDMEDSLLAKVIYSDVRGDFPLSLEGPHHFSGAALNDALLNALHTKYKHWEYESEVRAVVGLDETEVRKYQDMFFYPWGDTLQLKEVIIGARCREGRKKVLSALGDMRKSTATKVGRCGFNKYEIVEDLRFKR